MNEDKPVRTLEITDGALKMWESVHDTRTDAGRAAIEAGLAEFDQHEKVLLNNLRKVHERRMKSEPFDADKSWRHLVSLAEFYFWEAALKREKMPAAAIVKRLKEFANALCQARTLVQDVDIRGQLFDAWWDGPEYDPLGPYVDLPNSEREFRKPVEKLDILTALALQAVNDVPTKRGRPAMLSRRCIVALATVYRNGTGSIPGAGPGPFARFVCGFLNAIGQSNPVSASVIDAIKDARAWAQMREAPWGPSPFEE